MANVSCAPLSESPLPTATYTPAYTPLPTGALPPARTIVTQTSPRRSAGRFDHDTIGMCALDLSGRIAVGGSSNGATWKVPGRSSDIALVGAGAYADRDGGCAAATGDGDITMRFLPAFTAVELMRNGLSPQAACEAAVRRIMAYYGKDFHIGLICMDKAGRVGAAGQGWTWTYAVAGGLGGNATRVVQVQPLSA